MGLAKSALITHSLECVPFLPTYNTLYLLANFEYWFQKIQFEQRFQARRNEAWFVSWHCLDIFHISTRSRKKLFIQVPSWWADYEEIHLSFAHTQVVFAHHFTLALLKERGSLLFYITVAEHCVHLLSSFFPSAIIGGPVDNA